MKNDECLAVPPKCEPSDKANTLRPRRAGLWRSNKEQAKASCMSSKATVFLPRRNMPWSSSQY